MFPFISLLVSFFLKSLSRSFSRFSRKSSSSSRRVLASLPKTKYWKIKKVQTDNFLHLKCFWRNFAFLNVRYNEFSKIQDQRTIHLLGILYTIYGNITARIPWRLKSLRNPFVFRWNFNTFLYSLTSWLQKSKNHVCSPWGLLSKFRLGMCCLCCKNHWKFL